MKKQNLLVHTSIGIGFFSPHKGSLFIMIREEMKYKMNVYKLRKPNLFLNSHLKRFGVFENMGANSSNFNEISII